MFKYRNISRFLLPWCGQTDVLMPIIPTGATMTFLTKKQKRLMRERRRKFKQFGNKQQNHEKNQEDVTTTNEAKKNEGSSSLGEKLSSPNKKRPLSILQQQNDPQEKDELNKKQEPATILESPSFSFQLPPNSNLVVIPASLSTSEQKKFRKDCRRQARSQGRDADKLRFEIEGQQNNKKRRLHKKEFPNINQLVQQDQAKKQQAQQQQALQTAEAQLSDDYKSKYIAMDCEMVGIGTEGRTSALARVSLTDWAGATVLDTFVQVPTRVTDYRTWVSGVKAKHLKNAMKEDECRKLVASLIQDKIVVGHALHNDFKALFLTHPKEDIRDTAKHRRFQRYGGNKWRPRKLRDLVKEHLGLEIQQEGESHDSVDDAKASMELFKLAREEWEEELDLKRKKRTK